MSRLYLEGRRSLSQATGLKAHFCGCFCGCIFVATQSAFLWLLPQHGALYLWCRKCKAFLNVQLHCILSNLKRISKMLTLPPMGKILRTPMCISVVHTYCVISSNILSMIQCNVLVCEQFSSWHGGLQIYIAAVGCCFLAHVNPQRSSSQLVYIKPLIYTEPFNVALF